MTLMWLNHGLLGTLLFGIVSGQITLRYYGNRDSKPINSQTYLLDVCNNYPAVCVDLRLDVCTKAPPDLQAPFTQELVNQETRGTTLTMPSQTGGGNMLLEYGEVGEGGTRQLVMWSECDSECTNCRAGTGKALTPVRLNGCGLTTQGGIFAVAYNIQQNAKCVDSLERVPPTTNSIGIAMIATGTSICILAVCMFRCVWQRKCRHRLRRQSSSVEPPPPPPSISKEDMERQFPTTKVGDGPTCVVCLMVVEATEPCRILQCKHVFHADCILEWWTYQPRSALICPTCRQVQTTNATSAAPVVIGAHDNSVGQGRISNPPGQGVMQHARPSSSGNREAPPRGRPVNAEVSSPTDLVGVV